MTTLFRGLAQDDIDLLSIPFALEVQSCPAADGSWTRRLEYRDLDGCVVVTKDLSEGIELLERKRRDILLAGHPAPLGPDRRPLRCGPYSYSLVEEERHEDSHAARI